MSASYDHLEGLQLKGVTRLNRDELGCGAYGKVYAVKYCQATCTAKEIHSILVEGVRQVEMQRTLESFMRECRQCSMLRHPNVTQFLGVYYPSTGVGGANGMRLPVMVMEMMADSLTSFVEKHEKIPVHIKYSIVHDVSLGLCYLHNHDPPIVHRDLSPNNVLLTAHHVAKISDLGVAKLIKADSRKTLTKAPGTADFMPPESLTKSPVYGPPMDVFSFAGIILHTFNQQWPSPCDSIQFDPKTRKKIALLEVERRQQYLDKMIGEAEVLRRLVEECLDDDPAVRPTIATVCERIQVSKDVYIKKYPLECIALYQQVEQQKMEIDQQKIEIEQQKIEIEQQKIEIDQQKTEIEQQKIKIEQQKAEIEQLMRENKQQRTTVEEMSSTRYIPMQRVASQLSTITGEGLRTKRSKLRMAPPLMPALTSGRYHIKWTRLADLPVPLYGAYVTVQHHKIYVAGGDSPVEDAKCQVYVYDINADQWGQLPPSGHYYGIPHIIGGKLVIIGGRLSATKKMTNKVSTFDEDSQTWTSYYPDLLSVRSKPGVASHQEHVIVAGGGRPTSEGDDIPVILDDIEVLNWIENSHWRRVFIKLPVPMHNLTSTICNDHLLVVGYSTANARYRGSYNILLANITASIDQQCNSDKSMKWTKLNATDHDHDHYWATPVPMASSSPPVVVGGHDADHMSTADIKMYDSSNKSWKKIGSLSSARSRVIVAAVGDNAIIVIGGYTLKGNTRNKSSLMLVELGQAAAELATVIYN